MEAGHIRAITSQDLERAIRSVVEALGCSEIVVIGSQALLVGRDDIARSLRYSREIDLYPVDPQTVGISAEEASEEINAYFGEGSNFDQAHGFFIDGVDAKTAVLPPKWKSRAIYKHKNIGEKRVTVIAPEPNDLVVSKLVRGDPKDIKFAAECLKAGLVKYATVNRRLGDVLSEEGLERARRTLANTRLGGARNDQLKNSGLD